MGSDFEKLLSQFETLIKYIFSWIILMPISVILTGKWLNQVIVFDDAGATFKIPLKLFSIEARKGEVGLGFTCFILIFLLITTLYGHGTYIHFKDAFGIDPGQFTTLCIVSSFYSLALAVLIRIGFALRGPRDQSGKDRDKIIQYMADRKGVANE